MYSNAGAPLYAPLISCFRLAGGWAPGGRFRRNVTCFECGNFELPERARSTCWSRSRVLKQVCGGHHTTRKVVSQPQRANDGGRATLRTDRLWLARSPALRYAWASCLRLLPTCPEVAHPRCWRQRGEGGGRRCCWCDVPRVTCSYPLPAASVPPSSTPQPWHDWLALSPAWLEAREEMV